MKAKSQFDFHPDAERLNAFAERALAEEERGQIAEHLAICGRCRQVVFLAQAAATEEEQLASGLTERIEKRRGSWFRNWWIVCAPLGALATVVALAFYVHVRHTEADQEMAKATQEVPPLTGSQNGVVTTRPAETPPPGVTGGAVKGAEASRAAAGKPETKKSSAQEPLPPAPFEPTPPALGAVNELEVQPRLAAAAQSREAIRAMQTEERASASGEKNGHRKEEEMHGVILTAVVPAFNASAAPVAGFGAMANKTSTSALPVYPALLPSGLPAISRTTGLIVTLAVDKTGALFVSKDSGGHWESVARQWSDQAVAVRMQAEAAGVFELVNDKGQVWMSTDGRIWTAK
jgi:hypothetical protein